MMLDTKDNTRQFSDENRINRGKEMKYSDGDRVFLGCEAGNLLEYSMKKLRIVHDFGIVLDNHISSMAKTFDNKSLFICDEDSGFREFDISSHMKLDSFAVRNAEYCIVTYDNKFLITCEGNLLGANLSKWSIRTKKQLYTWAFDVSGDVWL